MTARDIRRDCRCDRIRRAGPLDCPRPAQADRQLDQTSFDNAVFKRLHEKDVVQCGCCSLRAVADAPATADREDPLEVPNNLDRQICLAGIALTVNNNDIAASAIGQLPTIYQAPQAPQHDRQKVRALLWIRAGQWLA
jgi:hypothetical protein